MDSRLILKDFIEGNGFDLALSVKTLLKDYNISTDLGYDISKALSTQYVSRLNGVSGSIESQFSLHNLNTLDEVTDKEDLRPHSEEVWNVIQNMLDLRVEGQHQADKIQRRIKSLSLEIQKVLNQTVNPTQVAKFLAEDVQSAIGGLSG